MTEWPKMIGLRMVTRSVAMGLAVDKAKQPGRTATAIVATSPIVGERLLIESI
jgi:hypothetical protein